MFKNESYSIFLVSVAGLDNWWESLSYAMKEIEDGHRKHPQWKRSEAGASLARYIEIMCVADRKFMQHHKNNDIEEYILATMNVVIYFQFSVI